jgi:hypothetical protein
LIYACHQAAKRMLDILHDWQTLIAGALALIAASLTIRAMNKQTNAAIDIAEKRRQSEERAARAALPLGLSDISLYSKRCIKLMAAQAESYSLARLQFPDNLEAPAFPNNSIELLQASARFATDGAGEKIATVLNVIQVQHARLISTLTKKRDGHGDVHQSEIVDAIFDAAELSVLVDELYEYGRSGRDKIKPSREAISNSLHNAGVYDGSSAYRAVLSLPHRFRD